MRLEDVLALSQPPQEREARVEDERPHEQDPGDREPGVVLRADERQRREDEAQERAPHVPHEDLRGRPVVDQEPETRGGQQQPQPRLDATGPPGERHPPQPCHDRLAPGDPVDPVHEVVGVGEPHDPDKRQESHMRSCPPSWPPARVGGGATPRQQSAPRRPHPAPRGAPPRAARAGRRASSRPRRESLRRRARRARASPRPRPRPRIGPSRPPRPRRSPVPRPAASAGCAGCARWAGRAAAAGSPTGATAPLWPRMRRNAALPTAMRTERRHRPSNSPASRIPAIASHHPARRS